jgi:hypothetical protein
MRTKNYTKSDIDVIFQKAGSAEKGLYDCGGPNNFCILDSKGSLQGEDDCRETTCDYIREFIENGEVPTYIGITTYTRVSQIIEVPKKIDINTYMDDLRSEKIRCPAHEAAIKKFKTKARRMSAAITSLEKRFNFKTHTLKCFNSSPGKICVEQQNIFRKIPKNNPRKVYVESEIEYIWALKIDKQWLSSPPVASYLMLCMRDSLNGHYSTRKTMSGTLAKMMKNKKPFEIFGKSRKANWGLGQRFQNYDDDGAYRTTYGVATFEKDVKQRNVLFLRSKFPNNKIFNKAS